MNCAAYAHGPLKPWCQRPCPRDQSPSNRRHRRRAGVFFTAGRCPRRATDRSARRRIPAHACRSTRWRRRTGVAAWSAAQLAARIRAARVRASGHAVCPADCSDRRHGDAGAMRPMSRRLASTPTGSPGCRHALHACRRICLRIRSVAATARSDPAAGRVRACSRLLTRRDGSDIGRRTRRRTADQPHAARVPAARDAQAEWWPARDRITAGCPARLAATRAARVLATADLHPPSRLRARSLASTHAALRPRRTSSRPSPPGACTARAPGLNGVVHIGAGDGALRAALRRHDAFASQTSIVGRARLAADAVRAASAAGRADLAGARQLDRVSARPPPVRGWRRPGTCAKARG